MKQGVVIAALLVIALFLFVAACGRVEPAGQPEQQPPAGNISEVEVKDGCDYNNPPCGESYDCLNNACIMKSGCSYDNPACSTTQDCINNSCMLKKGCNYNNPACDVNHTCTGNVCVLKSGCRYNNPPCNSSQICQNNKCFEHIFSSGGGGY